MSLPWHSPPCENDTNWYHLSAANFEHKNIIGLTPERMCDFEQKLLQKITPLCIQISAWCIMPSHYHLLVKTCDIQSLRKSLGHLHSRTSFQWNDEDKCSGRKCWHRCHPKKIKSQNGDHELYPSQPCSSQLCSILAGMAILKCHALSAINWVRSGYSNLG